MSIVCVAFAYNKMPALQRIRPELMKVGTNDTNLYLDHIEKIGKTPTTRRSYMDTIENRKTAEERMRRLIVIGANLRI